MSKKLVSLMLVTILIIGGVLVKPDTASAASTTTSYTQYHKAVGRSIKHTLFTSDSGANVKFSVVQGTVVGGTYECNGCQYDVKVELQRRVNGTFKTIATKSGTVRAGKPLHHTFTNVKPGRMRAIITSKLQGDTRVAVSTYWTR